MIQFIVSVPYIAHIPKDDCIRAVLFSLFGRAFGSVYRLVCVALSLYESRMFAFPYNLGAHLFPLYALFVFTLPEVLTFQTLFALLRLADRRQQFCAQTAYSP